MAALNEYAANVGRRIRHPQTRHHALWQISAAGMILLLMVVIPLVPYVIAPEPESDYAKIQRELDELGGRMQAELSGEPLSEGYTWLANARDVVLHHVASSWAGLLVLMAFALLVLTVLNTSDVIGRGLHRIRMKIWDTYGHEVHQQGFLTRVLAGTRAPAGARTAPTPATQPASAPASGASAPLTRRAFAISEIVIELLVPTLARLVRGR